MREHPMQRIKRENLSKIRGWISESGGMEKVNMSELIRKCSLVIGCTRRKAIEYITEITGEDVE